MDRNQAAGARKLPVYELAALGAAICWAISGLMSATAAAQLGAFGFNLYRQGLVTLTLAVIVGGFGLWHGLRAGQIGPLAMSGFIGIFLGDMMLFIGMNRIGPRRAGALFALNDYRLLWLPPGMQEFSDHLVV
ncbi:MAG: DMT family transporter [Paracoccus sp. (in: a-proteobacteria)]